MHWNKLKTPLGTLILVWAGKGLMAAGFEEALNFSLHELASKEACPQIYEDAFTAYFGGDTRALEQIPVQMEGSDFQKTVWRELQNIPAGETRSYQEIAVRIGNPNAVRAVGLANSRNPISIAIPCHRVIGKDGTLTGYAGGLERKSWLLKHEGAVNPES